jgi:pimeloyl-ACP methyl ester carboxylesterase
MSPTAGQLVTETFEYDGGRQVTAYVPPAPPEAIVFAGDGQLITSWGGVLAAAGLPPTMIIGAHRLGDETLRLHEYSPGESTPAFVFDPERFAAHETFFVEDVRRWARSRFEVALPADRTAVFGVSAGAELALAMGLRHPEIYGAVLCASPGAGYRPPTVLPSSLPRAYLRTRYVKSAPDVNDVNGTEAIIRVATDKATRRKPAPSRSGYQPAVSVDPVQFHQPRKRDDGRGPAARAELRPWPVSAPGPSGVRRGGDRQQVGSLVERVADMPLDPAPANLLVG